MTSRKSGGANRVRIIAGKWRGRNMPFPDVAGLRPTPDRVRETLFNWLQGIIHGARCLDLYAGSGALGIEALSRGAAEVVFVDRDRAVTDSLKRQIEQLNAAGGRVVQSDVESFLEHAARPFDVVFLDPPYGQGLLAPCCQLLEQHGWLAEDARIYLEAERTLQELPLPDHWELVRSKQAGQVGYHLALRQTSFPE